ncbi:MAG: hypothetical protein R2867_25990 [Caldilineaceae bacterium]
MLSDGIRPVPSGGDWSGALYRCEIELHPTSYTVQARPTYIGGAIHGDIHALQFAPATDKSSGWAVTVASSSRRRPLRIPWIQAKRSEFLSPVTRVYQR